MSKAKRSIQRKEKGVKEEVKKENILKKGLDSLKQKIESTSKSAKILFIMIVICIITGTIGYNLYIPARDIYITDSKSEEEKRKVYDFPEGSEERKAQEEIYQESLKVYGETRDKYNTKTDGFLDSLFNGLLLDFIHYDFARFLIIFGILLPFLAIFLMFIGGPINFTLAIINITILAPYKILKYFFNIFREKNNSKNKEKQNAKIEMESKHSKNKKTSSKHSLETA